MRFQYSTPIVFLLVKKKSQFLSGTKPRLESSRRLANRTLTPGRNLPDNLAALRRSSYQLVHSFLKALYLLTRYSTYNTMHHIINQLGYWLHHYNCVLASQVISPFQIRLKYSYMDLSAHPLLS